MYQPRLVQAVQSERPPPCIGCQHYARCAADSLACVRFHAYVNGGSSMIRVAIERGESLHEPSRERYEKVFGDDE